jgi:purine-binding chemotaxis protein CheW
VTDLQDTFLEMEDSQKSRFLTFFTGKEVYGIEIRFVTEIVGCKPSPRCPNFPSM